MADTFPDIPDDIVRLIFEAAIEEDRHAALDLLIVARHVYRWIRPLLYRVVDLQSKSAAQSFLDAVSSKPGSMGKRVRTMILRAKSLIDVQTVEAIIPHLENLESLAAWIFQVNALLALNIFPASLRRLSLPFDSLLGNTLCLLPNTITHLELHNLSFMELFVEIEHLTRLTHLCVRYWPVQYQSIKLLVEDLVVHLPKNLQQFLLPYRYSMARNLTDWFINDCDPRIVFIAPRNRFAYDIDEEFGQYMVTDLGSSVNWGHKAAGEPDIWELAADAQEKLALKRKEIAANER
ncbi:hypothetical protein C8J56DRAFT_1051410 [Mycena floridula]|nr:hypothetical protein C8J56DRAFT_1051410 [Mycena floridula]